MSIIVHTGGLVVTPEKALVSVLDRGFLFGDSVYETLACLKRKPVFFREHLDRLDRSAQRIGLQIPERCEIEKAVQETLAAANVEDQRLRIIVTRGVGPLDLDPSTAGPPTLIVISSPLSGPTPAMLTQGVSVEIVSYSRGSGGGMDPAVKSGNYLTSVLAIGEARKRRPLVHEAILCTSQGAIAEGATSNVFLVVGQTFITPALSVGILEGVTRGKVMMLAKEAGFNVSESQQVTPDDLMRADEIFLTSAVRGILPVTMVNGNVVGDGIPGPMTRRLRALYLHSIGEAP